MLSKFPTTLFTLLVFLTTTALAAPEPVITPAPASLIPRQLPDDITSAREYLSSCQRSCTDDVQSQIISSRLAVDHDDQFCNNYGNKEDDGNACYCGNLLQDADAQMTPLRSCIRDSCTDMSDEAFTFLGVGEADKVSAFVRQLGMECRPSVDLFELTRFPGGGGSSTSDDSETTTTRSGGEESATRVSSISESRVSSSSVSRVSSSGVSSTTSASASATDSSDSATNMMVALPDTAFLATLVCGLIMAVTVYAL